MFPPRGSSDRLHIIGLFLGKEGLFQAQDKALAPLWQADQEGIMSASSEQDLNKIPSEFLVNAAS